MTSRELNNRMKYYEMGNKVCELADKKLDNLKAQRELKAIMFLNLAKACGLPLQAKSAEVVENFIDLLDSLITLKIQDFTNDFRENPLPYLFFEQKHSWASENLYKDTGKKSKSACCKICGGEFSPVAFGNTTCGECLLRGGKSRGGKRGGGKC